MLCTSDTHTKTHCKQGKRCGFYPIFFLWGKASYTWFGEEIRTHIFCSSSRARLSKRCSSMLTWLPKRGDDAALNAANNIRVFCTIVWLPSFASEFVIPLCSTTSFFSYLSPPAANPSVFLPCPAKALLSYPCRVMVAACFEKNIQNVTFCWVCVLSVVAGGCLYYIVYTT